MPKTIQTVGRVLLLVILLYLWVLVVLQNKELVLLSGVNLIFHEAGHIIFLFFGQFLHILGGTILQLIVPGSIVLYFLARKLFFSASVVLFWLGQNFIDIAVYINDAQTMSRPLLGDIHDWAYLLGKAGLIKSAWVIGDSVAFIGVILMSVALVAAFTTTIVYYFDDSEKG